MGCTGSGRGGIPAHILLLLTPSPPGSLRDRIWPCGGASGSDRAPARTARRQVSGVGYGDGGAMPGRTTPPLALSPPSTQHPTPGRAGGRGVTRPAPPACWTPPRAGWAPRHRTRYGPGVLVGRGGWGSHRSPTSDGCVSPPAGRTLALGPGEGAAHPPDPPLAAGRPMQVEPEWGSPVPPPPLDRRAALHLLRHTPPYDVTPTRGRSPARRTSHTHPPLPPPENKAFSLPKRRLFCEAVCSCAVTSLSSAPA